MIAEILVWGFFSAMGWMAANWTIDKITPEKIETQVCSVWQESQQPDGTIKRTRTCESKK